MSDKHSQTATEYLIILAVVIVIALIVVGVLGGIPSIGGGAGKQSSSVKLMTAKIGVMNHDLSNESLKLILRNNLAESMSLSSLTIEKTICSAVNIPSILRSGQKKTFICTNINSNATGTQYEYDLAINYTDVATQAQYTLDGLELVGVVSGLAGSGSESLASGFTGWCYQETANASHASDGDCDLDYGGSYGWFGDWDSSYPVNLSIDGNWDANYGACEMPSIAYIYINYTKPVNWNGSAIWQIDTGLRFNVTLPESCLSQTPIQLLFDSDCWGNEGIYKCYNGTTWKTLGYSFYQFHEEAMWWYIE